MIFRVRNGAILVRFSAIDSMIATILMIKVMFLVCN